MSEVPADLRIIHMIGMFHTTCACARHFGRESFLSNRLRALTTSPPVPKIEGMWERWNRNPPSDEERRRNMKILMVLTSHDQLGGTGRKTGFWLEEFAAPYFVFRDAGVELTLASPKGGQPPIDPKSDLPENQTAAMARFKQDPQAQKALSQTVTLSDVKAEDYDTVFYVGGHGPMWDLAESADSIALIEAFYNSGKPVALVCHSPGVLHRVTYKGEPIVKGKRVTGFTNDEEEAVHLTNVVPFLVEDELKRLGAVFEKAPSWQPFSIVDGRLLTGQNPASSSGAAEALLKLVGAKKAA